MKKIFIVLMAIAFLGFSANAFAAISGSAHDFSDDTWNSGGQICQPCHTPHNADTSVTDTPLWNHEVTLATYTLYSSSTMDATDMGQPDGRSKLCLSCHDGTVALDSFGGATGGTNITGDALIGTALGDDHPISFTYDTVLATADGELFDPAATDSGLGGTITVDMLFAAKLECASCHDPHGTTFESLLVKSNASSALCMTCHDK